MKSREEILSKYKPLHIYEKTYSEKDVLEAMEEYANQSRQAAVSGSVCQHEFYDKDQDFIANQCVKCGEPKHTN